MRIAAGDFKYNNGYFTYEDGNNVMVSYSKYNQNNWTNLEVTKYPEFFQMPAFGDYYEASLAGIPNESENVWYDLKVISTDENGSKQEQIISPAFKVNGNLAVENSSKSNLMVYPNPFDKEIHIKIPEEIEGNYRVKIMDFTGRIIYQKNQNEKSFIFNGSTLSKGLYILSIENEGNTIVKKIIKK